MTLYLQALRSIWRQKHIYAACVLLMALGVSIYVAFNQLYTNLSAAQAAMYTEQRFADAFATVRSIPLADAEGLAQLDGISEVQARVTIDARVDTGSNERVSTLRLNSYDPADSARLNDFKLEEGAAVAGSLLLGSSYAKANGIAAGDELELIIGSRQATLPVSGIILSPEYIYAIPDAAQLLPDDKAFGFAFLDAALLGQLTGMAGAANNLSFKLDPGADFSALKDALEDGLEPYGLTSLVERKDQASNTMLSSEIDGLGSMSTSMPMLFIIIAVVILYIMLKRIIEQERSQIGTLKAFGYSSWKILAHYLLYGVVTGAAGGVLGGGLGLAMTGGMTDMYLQYFNMPAIQVPPSPLILVAGFALSLAGGALGALMGARKIVSLPPAEAMRPYTPPMTGKDLLARVPALMHLLASHGVMALRNIGRNGFRSAFVVLGLAASFAICAFTSSYNDMFDAMLLDRFNKVEHFDVQVALRDIGRYDEVVDSAYALEGATQVEGMLEVPVELAKSNLKKTVLLTALEPTASLYRLYDSEAEAYVPLADDGLVLSQGTAADLKVRAGDVVDVKTAYTGDDVYPVRVAKVFNSGLGGGAYMSLEAFCELIGTQPAVNTALLRAEDTDAVKEALRSSGAVAGVTDQDESQSAVTEMFDTYSAMIYMMQLAGAAIALVIIVNTASVSLSERKREYATMRVLGMHPKEIVRIVGFEYWLLFVVSLPIGMALTRLFKESLSGVYDIESFTMPVTTKPASYLAALVLCAAAVFCSNLYVRRKIAKFDMVEVLKERE